ncbi:MAG: PIN domain-containing protein [Vicinamibacterales bacterium]
MTGLFVDTAGWIACADRADPAHDGCRAARDRAMREGLMLVTTDFVADETLTLMRVRLGLRVAEAWWRQVDGSARVRWERISHERFDRALELFFRYRDKGYSFTDCTSFAVMRELTLTTALTTDKHFKQMGFAVVPGGRVTARR